MMSLFLPGCHASGTPPPPPKVLCCLYSPTPTLLRVLYCWYFPLGVILSVFPSGRYTAGIFLQVLCCQHFSPPVMLLCCSLFTPGVMLFAIYPGCYAPKAHQKRPRLVARKCNQCAPVCTSRLLRLSYPVYRKEELRGLQSERLRARPWWFVLYQ